MTNAWMMYSQDYDEQVLRTTTCGAILLETGFNSLNQGCNGPPAGMYYHLWQHMLQDIPAPVPAPSNARKVDGGRRIVLRMHPAF